MTVLNNSLNNSYLHHQPSIKNSLSELSQRISKLEQEKCNPPAWEVIAVGVAGIAAFALSCLGIFWILTHIDPREIGAGAGAWAMATGLTFILMGPVVAVGGGLINYFECRRAWQLHALYNERTKLLYALKQS